MPSLKQRRAVQRQKITAALCFICVIVSCVALAAVAVVGRQSNEKVAHGKRYRRLIIRNAMIVDGNGTPASGPKDIVIEGNTIVEIVSLDPVAVKGGEAKRPQGGVEIDAGGKYVLPGLINLHGHVQEERGGVPQPLAYELKLWLACGITTVRDVSSETKRTLDLRRQSSEGKLEAPRLFVY
ncbi:MAG: hypothetical protein WCD76_02645, partial [Pyrinomonadaceae bacterium]